MLGKSSRISIIFRSLRCERHLVIDDWHKVGDYYVYEKWSLKHCRWMLEQFQELVSKNLLKDYGYLEFFRVFNNGIAL